MKLLVGGGPESASYRDKGWKTNDVYPFPGVDFLGPCWDLPILPDTVDEILAKGMLEHLTYLEVARSLNTWRRVLVPGGHVTFDVPDFMEYITAALDLKAHPEKATGEGVDGGATGEPDDLAVCTGVDRWLRRALWGWQRWPGDEHRSGWTQPLLEHYLKRQFTRWEIRRMAISFDEDVPVSRVRHLWARAWK